MEMGAKLKLHALLHVWTLPREAGPLGRLRRLGFGVAGFQRSDEEKSVLPNIRCERSDRSGTDGPYVGTDHSIRCGRKGAAA